MIISKLYPTGIILLVPLAMISSVLTEIKGPTFRTISVGTDNEQAQIPLTLLDFQEMGLSMIFLLADHQPLKNRAGIFMLLE
jgi:hypothetical protein